MTPDMTAKDVVLTRKTQMIEEQLRRNWDWGMATDMTLRLNEYENQLWVCYPPGAGEGEISALAAALIAKSRQTRSLHAMQDLVTHLGSIRDERKAVIAVSGGWRLIRDSEALMKLREGEAPPGVDTITVGPNGKLTRRDPRITGGGDYLAKSECDAQRMQLAQTDNQQEFRDLLDDANRANASFYPIDPEGLRVNPGSSLDRLYELASNTDGIPIVNTNDLHKGVSRVVDDLTSYYLVGYTSTNTKSDGRVRHIQVKVKGSGIQVRHRRSYRAPSAAETTSGPATPAPPDPGARALSDAIASLSRKPTDTRFSIAAAHVTNGSEATIWIAGHVTAPSGAPDEFLAGGRADLEIQAGGYSTRAEVTIEPGERGFVTSVKVPVSAATELNVRARASSEVSAAPVTATLASRVGPGLAQPLLLTRGPATGNRLAPTADRYFTRNERIRVDLPVPPGVNVAGARLLDKNGVQLRPAVTSSERVDDASGQRWVSADLALAVLGAGDYAIEIAVDDAGTSRKVITAFRVTR
jgi:VWFA-related protein